MARKLLSDMYWCSHAAKRTEEVKLWMGMPSTYNPYPESSMGFPSAAYKAGAQSAHAAFLAMPELREEDDGVSGRPDYWAEWIMRNI